GGEGCPIPSGVPMVAGSGRCGGSGSRRGLPVAPATQAGSKAVKEEYFMAATQYFKAARRDPLWVLGWVIGFWLFGVMLVLIINATVNDEQDYACMGTLFSLAGVLPGVLLRGNTNGF